MQSKSEKGNAPGGRSPEASSVKNPDISQGFNMVDFTARTEMFRISPTHCQHGVLALARMGVHMEYLGDQIAVYQGTRQAMLHAGVISEDQLPGNGYAHSKKFTSCRGQLMRVVRKGKDSLTVWVQCSLPLSNRDIETGLDIYEHERCLNSGLDLIRRIGQKSLEVSA